MMFKAKLLTLYPDLHHNKKVIGTPLIFRFLKIEKFENESSSECFVYKWREIRPVYKTQQFNVEWVERCLLNHYS